MQEKGESCINVTCMHICHDLWAAIIIFSYLYCVCCTGNGCLNATEANHCKIFMCMATSFIAQAQTLYSLPFSLNAILDVWRCLSHCITYHKETKAKPSSKFSCLIIFSLFAGVFDRIYRSIVHLFSVLFPHDFCLWTG